MHTYLPVLISAFLLAFAFTPLVLSLAKKIGAIDIPKDIRRVHKVPIPRMGGLAIYGGFVLTILIFMPITREISGMLAGATLLVILGMIDDTRPLSAKIKLVFQIAAALIVVHNGVKVEWITNPLGGMLYVGRYSTYITVLWIVGITNTLNFIDGLDGLAAGVAAIASITLMLVANSLGYIPIALISAALAGGTLGFLPYNFNPAKIFMGDTGSMLLGFILASVSVMGAIKSAATLALIIPVLALGLPIFDTAFAIFRRFINRTPIMEADRGHLHHRLLDMGLTQRQAVIALYGVSICLGGSALTLTKNNLWSFLSFSVILMGCFVYAVKLGVFTVKKTNIKINSNIKG